MILAAAAFAIASNTFSAGGKMPMSTVYDSSGCSGKNRSPQLSWTGAPAGTRSFAIVMHDPDAPVAGGWYHWVVYNLPASTRELREGAQLPDSELGMTSWQEARYGGPCPPAGKPHHYVITLYALDVKKLSGAHLSGPQVEAAVSAHTLARTTVTGIFQQ